MKTLRFILVIALIGIGTISCRKTSEEEKQDVLEDVNEFMEPMDDIFKKKVPKNEVDSEDELIQQEINKIQDSISNESSKN